MRTVSEIFRSFGIVNNEGVHINGTDKMTNHRYGDAYENILKDHKFNSIRQDVKLMMEIGIADGSSLLAWREIFPNALCVGMDIHPSDKAHGDRIEFHIGNQAVKEDCERAANGRLFDVIVEDATHQLENNLLTLFYMWPYIKSGGLYIIEEFAGIHAFRNNIKHLFPFASIIDTQGPFGGIEPLVVFKKPYDVSDIKIKYK